MRPPKRKHPGHTGKETIDWRLFIRPNGLWQAANANLFGGAIVGGFTNVNAP
jgi:hypothetical protein